MQNYSLVVWFENGDSDEVTISESTLEYIKKYFEDQPPVPILYVEDRWFFLNKVRSIQFWKVDTTDEDIRRGPVIYR